MFGIRGREKDEREREEERLVREKEKDRGERSREKSKQALASRFSFLLHLSLAFMQLTTIKTDALRSARTAAAAQGMREQPIEIGRGFSRPLEEK